MPSALTGNTSGLATAVSPGLVGITTQTFAGKKTLDGGALIKGDTSGVAIAAGYVGETVSTLLTAGGVTSVAGTFVDGTGTMTLTAGIWLVTVLNSLAITLGVTNVNAVTANTSLRTSTNTVAASAFSQIANGIASSVTNIIFPHTITAIVNISASTTYKISILCNSSSGASGGTATFYADGTSGGSGTVTVGRMSAARIA